MKNFRDIFPFYLVVKIYLYTDKKQSLPEINQKFKTMNIIVGVAMWKHHELEEMLSSILGWNFDDVGFLGCVWPSRKHRFIFHKQVIF